VDASRFSSRTAARLLAEQIAVRGRAGEDFAQLGLQFDNGDSRFRGGEAPATCTARSGPTRPKRCSSACATARSAR